MAHTILITAHPESPVVSRLALSCCQSIVAEGGRINQIFFMHEANYIAIHPSAQQWSVFAAGNNIALQTCVSTAEQKSIHLRDYAAGFQQGGLSSLADSLLNSERFLQFNADFDSAKSLKKLALNDKKKIIFVFDSAPEEGSLAAEGIDLLLVLSAFEADISVVFKGDGIQNIMESNDEKFPRYTKRFLALADFDVDKLYILDERVLDDESGEALNKVDHARHQTKVSYETIPELTLEKLTQSAHVLHF